MKHCFSLDMIRVLYLFPLEIDSLFLGKLAVDCRITCQILTGKLPVQQISDEPLSFKVIIHFVKCFLVLEIFYNLTGCHIVLIQTRSNLIMKECILLIDSCSLLCVSESGGATSLDPDQMEENLWIMTDIEIYCSYLSKSLRFALSIRDALNC